MNASLVVFARELTHCIANETQLVVMHVGQVLNFQPTIDARIAYFYNKDVM